MEQDQTGKDLGQEEDLETAVGMEIETLEKKKEFLAEGSLEEGEEIFLRTRNNKCPAHDDFGGLDFTQKSLISSRQE